MRSVYSVQFEVLPPEHGSVEAMPALLLQRIENWVKEWYARHKGISPEVPMGGGDSEIAPGHRLRIEQSSDQVGRFLWELIWSHPSADDPGLLWTSHLVVARSEERTEFSINIRLESTVFRLSPLEFEVGRPRVVRDLLGDFPCRQGEVPLSLEPQVIRASGTTSFVENELLSHSRHLPVVLLSPDPWTGEFSANPSQVANALAGLARVAILADKWAGFALTREIGKALSCFNGAVRIYWPGCSRTGDPYAHPLFFPDKIKEWVAEGRSLPQMLMRRLAPISAYRFVEGEVTADVRRAIELHRKKEDADRREQIRTGTADAAALKEELAEVWKEVDRLEKEKRDDTARLQKAELESAATQQTIQALTDELEGVKESIRQINEYRGSIAKAKETPASAEEPKTVRAALDKAARESKGRMKKSMGRMIVWPSAEEAAGESRFARPEQVYEALLAITEVMDMYFESKERGAGMGPWEKAFEDRGFEYVAHEAQTTLTMYGAARTFTHKGRRLLMEKHITIGGGDRENCLSIYFEPDDEKKTVNIGHCGVHLPYARQRT